MDAEYSPWTEGHPQEGLTCGAIDAMGKLMSVDCNAQIGFVCQRGLGTAIVS